MCSGVLWGVRPGSRGCRGVRRAAPSGCGRARGAAQGAGDGVSGAVQGVRGLRQRDLGIRAGRGCEPGAVRSGRQGTAGVVAVRELRAGAPRGGDRARPAGDRGRRRVRRLDPRAGRRADRGEVPAACAGAADRGAGRARGRDVRARAGEAALPAHRLHRVPDRDARRGPLRGRDRRRRGLARVHRCAGARRVRRVHPPRGDRTRLVRSSSPA